MTQQTIESISIQVHVDKEKVSHKVDRAVAVHRLLEEFETELKALKVELRQIALTGAYPKTETGGVEIRSTETDNCALVVQCKDTPVFIKGADRDAVRTVVTQSEFNMMFKQVIEMVEPSKFEPTFNLLPKSKQKALLKVITFRQNDSQVRLSK